MVHYIANRLKLKRKMLYIKNSNFHHFPKFPCFKLKIDYLLKWVIKNTIYHFGEELCKDFKDGKTVFVFSVTFLNALDSFSTFKMLAVNIASWEFGHSK